MPRLPCELSGYCERGLDHEGACGPAVDTTKPLEQQLAHVLAPLVAERDLFKAESEALRAEVERLKEERASAHEAFARMGAQVIMLKADIAGLVRDRDAARAHTSNLLARIHRDGGQYETLHGTDNAVADADRIVANLFATARDTAERQRAACAEQAKKHTVVVDPWGVRSREAAERAVLATPLVTEE